MAKVYVYGLRMRGCPNAPKPEDGLLDIEVDPLDDYETVLVYSKQIPQEEADSYNMDFLGVRMQ